MEQPGETARDNGPASSADGADAGPVVSGSFSRMRVPAPTGDFERLIDVGRSIASMREAFARFGEALQQAAPGLRVGIDPATREGIARQVAGAFDIPPEFAFGRPVDTDPYGELIRSTRAEFPYDPWDYGDREPHGPMRWTPPPEGEDVPPCPF